MRLRGALDLDEDERFATNPARVHNRTALVALLSERLRARDTDDWIAVLRAAGAPAAPVQDVLQAARHAQTDALGMLQELGSATIVARRFPPTASESCTARRHRRSARTRARCCARRDMTTGR